MQQLKQQLGISSMQYLFVSSPFLSLWVFYNQKYSKVVKTFFYILIISLSNEEKLKNHNVRCGLIRDHIFLYFCVFFSKRG
jgi:hypothetical protein